MPIETQITETDLRAEHARSGLAVCFEAAMANPAMRKALENGIKAQRRQQARQALAAAATHYQDPAERDAA